MGIPQNVKHRATLQLATALLATHPKERAALTQRQPHPDSQQHRSQRPTTADNLCVCQRVTRWMKAILPFGAAQTGLEGPVGSEMRQAEKDNGGVASLPCGIYKTQARRCGRQGGETGKVALRCKFQLSGWGCDAPRGDQRFCTHRTLLRGALQRHGKPPCLSHK